MTAVPVTSPLDSVEPDPRTAYEHFSVQMRDDHAAIHAALRTGCPLHSDAYGGHWVILDHELVNRAARVPEALSSRVTNLPQPEGLPLFPPLNLDPPEHQKYRMLFAADFSPGRIATFGERISAQTDELIDGFIELGRADLATELVFPLTARATSLFLGIEDADVPEFQQRAMDLVTGLFVDPESYHEVIAGTIGFFLRHIAKRREEPADDLATHLLNAKVDGEVISDELSAMIHLVFNGAAGETTAAGATSMFLILDERRDLRARLLEEPALAPTAVDEMIRYISPIPGFRRDATTAVTVGGVEIEAGETVWMSYLAANFDPMVFDRPEEIVLDRSPNRHLSFGAGIHRCPGAPLARMEMEILLDRVLARLPDYRVTDRQAAALKPSATRLRSNLPVEFTPGPKVGA
jgi:cytochrome P450